MKIAESSKEGYKFKAFLHMTVSSLQDYLSLRALSKSGKKEELVARAFGAYELNVSIKFPQEMIFNELNKEYRRRLITHNAPGPGRKFVPISGSMM